jgi:hypothetical protein
MNSNPKATGKNSLLKGKKSKGKEKEEKGQRDISIGMNESNGILSLTVIVCFSVIYTCDIILKISGLKQCPFYYPQGICGFTQLPWANFELHLM